MTVAVARKSSTRRTLLLAALGVILLDAFAIATFGGVGLNGFPVDVIKLALEPIVPHSVINLGSEEHHVATLFDFYPSITGSIIMSWIVMVVVIVAVEGQRPAGPAAEKGAVFGGRSHHIRCAVAADMAVEADNAV